MAEGRFLKFPGKKESKTFIRNKKNIPGEEFEELVSSWEEKTVRSKEKELPGLLRDYEVKKTPEQIAVLDFVLEGVREFVENYGTEANQLALNDVHLLEDEFWTKIGLDNDDGVSFPVSAEIGVRFKNDMTNLHLATIAFHELMHQNSFARVACEGAKEDGEPKFAIERNALSTINASGDEFYMERLNEALTTELTDKFIQGNREHPFFKEDFQEMDELYSKEEQKGAAYMYSRVREDGEVAYYLERGYIKARENMHAMFDDVLEKNPEQFSSQEEVFDFFARAYFKGDLMGISRLLKKTYNNRPIKEIIAEKGL